MLCPSATDEYLVSEVLAGNKVACDLLIVRHQSAVVRLAAGFTSDWGSADAISRESFISTFHRLHSCANDASFYTFLCGVTVNASIAHMRSRGMHNNTVTMRDHNICAVTSDNEVKENLLDNAVDKSTMRRVHEILDELPIDFKAIFLLNEIGNLNYTEIAHIFGVSESTIRLGIFRSREALTKGLKGYI